MTLSCIYVILIKCSDFPGLGVCYKWNHAVCIGLDFFFFDVLEIPFVCSMYLYFIFALLYSVPLYDCFTVYLVFCLWRFDNFQFLCCSYNVAVNILPKQCKLCAGSGHVCFVFCCVPSVWNNASRR